MRHRLMLLLILLCSALFGTDALAKEVQGKDDAGRDYWVYTPDRIDPDKTYTLVVGVHGYRGNGKEAGGVAGWVNKHDVIVLGPTYDSNGYQYLDAGSDQQTVDLFKVLAKDYKLHDKLFIAGFSGGSQYAHRFAMKYPELVAGCAAHSGGTWATGDYPRGEKPNPEARGVMFVISCGEKDTGKSFPQAPMGRLDWAKQYESMLKEGGFVYDAKWVPGVAHRYSQEAQQMTEDCFLASTQLMPGYHKAIESVRSEIEAGAYAKAWAAIAQQRRTRRPRQRDGIIATAYQSQLDRLAALADELDGIGVEQVAAVVGSDAEQAEQIKAIRKLMQVHRYGPRSRAAAKEALGNIRDENQGEQRDSPAD